MLGSSPSPGGRKRGQTTCVASVQFRLLRRARMSLDLAGYLSLAMANRFLGVQDPAMPPPSQTYIRPFLTPSTVGATARPPPKSTSTLGSQLPNGGVGICRGGGGRRLGGSEGEGGDDMQDSESPSQGKAGQEERRRSGHARGSTPSGRRTVAPVVEARLHALRRERGRRRHASRRPARKAARQAEATCDAGAVPLR